MRQFYDVKVYLNPPEDLRRVWKIKRDTTKRGYTPEQVLAELEKREPDSRDFIRPQREYADIVVQFHPPAGVAPEQAGPNLNVRLILRPTIPHPDLSYLVDDQHDSRSGIRLELGRDRRPPGRLPGDRRECHARTCRAAGGRDLAAPARPAAAARRPVRRLQDRAETRHSDPLALTQLLLTYHLLRKYTDVQMLPFAPPVAALSRLQSTPTVMEHVRG